LISVLSVIYHDLLLVDSNIHIGTAILSLSKKPAELERPPDLATSKYQARAYAD